MKRYVVYFKEKVCRRGVEQYYNKEARRWEDREVEEWDTFFEFSGLREAKKLIKENIDKYKGSSIYKLWNNGDFENLGEISLNGSNKTFVANTRQRIASY